MLQLPEEGSARVVFPMGLATLTIVAAVVKYTIVALYMRGSGIRPVYECASALVWRRQVLLMKTVFILNLLI